MTITASKFEDAFTGSGFVYLGGSGSGTGVGGFWNTFSGSLMEYRLWSEPLSVSVFNNHVRAPKHNGNTSASSYNNLVVRYQLDDNHNMSASMTESK